MQAHEQFENSGAQQHGILSLPCRNNLAQSAMLAAVLDLRPLSFAENQEGMAYLLRAMFEAGQSIPLGVMVDKKRYITARTAICSAIENMVGELRITVKDKLLISALSIRGATTADCVTLKVQNNHYYDFNLNHFVIKKPQTL